MVRTVYFHDLDCLIYSLTSELLPNLNEPVREAPQHISKQLCVNSCFWNEQAVVMNGIATCCILTLACQQQNISMRHLRGCSGQAVIQGLQRQTSTYYPLPPHTAISLCQKKRTPLHPDPEGYEPHAVAVVGPGTKECHTIVD